jgi:hypothetical protein
MRRRMWRHGRSLRHGRGMECRRGGTRHGWRRRRTGHGRWCCWPSCRRCGRPRWSTPSVSLAGSLGGRADARCQHRDTNQKSRQANATRKHDRRSQLVIAHNFERTGGGIVRCWPRPALRSSAAGSLKRNPASGSWRAARAPSRSRAAVQLGPIADRLLTSEDLARLCRLLGDRDLFQRLVGRILVGQNNLF